jgi:hypothetical protein
MAAVMLAYKPGAKTKTLAAKSPRATESKKPKSAKPRKVIARYDYHDEEDNFVFQKERMKPKGFRFRRPDGNDGWVWKLKGVRHVLYHLPQLQKAKFVYLCEGEKDVHSLEALGKVATTNPMGAGEKWTEEYSEMLKEKTVFILFDNDAAGKSAAEKKAQSLHKHGISCKIVELPDLPEKGDVTDWVNAGGTGKQLAKLVNQTDWYKPAVPASPDAGELITVRASDVPIKPVSWLWPRRIPLGKLTILAGDPGLAKSTIAISIAAVVTGKPNRFGRCIWPDGKACDISGSVAILSAEDDAEDTLVPRLKAAGADLGRVHIVQSVLVGYTGQGEQEGDRIEKLFSLQMDLDALDKKIREIGDVAMLVIDPVTAYLDGIDSYKNSEVRGVLAPLKALAHKHNLAVVLITHMNKDSSRALTSISGSLAFVAAARAVYLVVEDALDTEHRRRLVLPIKNNLGSIIPGMAYKVESAKVDYKDGTLETAMIEWDAINVEVTAQKALALARHSDRADEMGPKERSVIELLAGEGKLMPGDIAKKLKWPNNNTYAVLHRLREKKLVVKWGKLYGLPA